MKLRKADISGIQHVAGLFKHEGIKVPPRSHLVSIIENAKTSPFSASDIAKLYIYRMEMVPRRPLSKHVEEMQEWNLSPEEYRDTMKMILLNQLMFAGRRSKLFDLFLA